MPTEAALDPVPDAEPDLLQDLVIDQVLESVIGRIACSAGTSRNRRPSWNDQRHAELWDQPVDVAWPAADQPDAGN